MRSVRGYQAAVCVHVDTQSGCFHGEEAQALFALQFGVEYHASEAERVLVWLRFPAHEAGVESSVS